MSIYNRGALALASCLALASAACDDDVLPDTPDAGGGGDPGTPGAVSCNAGVPTLPESATLPIVFVHGFAGSAQQYESQAMRFAANGYPLDRIYAIDHHGGMELNNVEFFAELNELIDEARAKAGTDKVYLAGHSRGTLMSSLFLSEPAQAAKVAKYVSLDGLGCLLVGGVECLAVSQATFPGQRHVEVATSKESFERQFEFFVGQAPTVSDIVPESGLIEISGRAVNFPANTGRAGTTLNVYELNPETGHRVGAAKGTYNIDASGDFGPLAVKPTTPYELVLSDDAGRQHHFYPQPFLRCDKFVRLLSGPSDSDARRNTNSGPGHSAVVAMRMREWTTEDSLTISTSIPGAAATPAVDAIVPHVGSGNIAIYLHDDAATPQQSSLAPLTAFTSGAFQTGVDMYMPANAEATGTITLTNLPRGDASKPQVIRTPNWPSTNHTLTVVFADYAQ